MPPRRSHRRVDLLWVALLALISFSAAAQPRPAPWTLEQQASEIQSVDESQAFHSKRAKRLAGDPMHAETKTRVASRVIEQRAPGAGTNQTIHPQEIVVPEDLAAEITQEIRLLAYGLEYDPLKIFLFVRNQIDMQRLSGIGKSALETLVARQGNDMEQAALMVALLRASGISASYVYGGMTYTPEQVVNWWGSGTRTQPTTVARTWVQFEVDGTVYAADPAYKQFEYTSAVDFFPQLGFDLDELVAQVTQGATQGPNSIRNFNTANLEALMRTYTARLTEYLRQNHFADQPQDILGGRSILPVELGSLGGLSLLPNYEIATWQFIPTEFHDSLTLRLQGQEHRFLGVELGTRRLTVTYNAGTGQPELRLDGDLILAAAAIPEGTEIEACFFPDFYVDRPGPTFPGFDCKRFGAFPGHTHALANSLRGAQGSVGTLDYAQKKLQDFREAGLPNASEAIRGETLNVLGRSFMNYTFTFYRQVLRAHGYESAGGSAIGWVSETGSGGIDWDYASIAVYALDDAQLDLQPVSRAGWHIGTAFEAGLFEHVFGAGTGLSTSKVLHLNNEGGGDTFYVTDQNFASIRPSLTNWDELQLNRFEAGLDAGQGFMILPGNGAVPLLSAQARAWISYGNSSDTLDLDGYRFGLGFNGGGAAEEGDLDVDGIQSWCIICVTGENILSFENGLNDNPFSGDPVDMLTGFLISEDTDLSLGDAPPLGLNFTRFYSSSSVDRTSPMGRGWEYSANIAVTRNSQPSAYLGGRSVAEAAAMMVYAEVAPRIMEALVDCYSNACATDPQREVTGWMIVNQMANWFVDQTVDNAVTLYQGFEATQFILLPDGSYSSPLGSRSELNVGPDGAFVLRHRDGKQFVFDATGLVTEQRDLVGNVLRYVYQGGRLVRLVDEYGRTISLDYSGEYISRITDSIGRLVQYSHDAEGNLVGVVDPDGHLWQYGYDGENRLVSMINPLGEQTIGNVFNEVDQVIQQTAFRQAGAAVYQYFFTDRTNVEIDPYGQRSTYVYDRKGRLTRYVDKADNIALYHHNGENRLVREVDVRGVERTMQFDLNNDLIRQASNGQRPIHYAYNEFGSVTERRNAAEEIERSEFDPLNLRVRSIDRAGNVTISTYDSIGREVTRTDPVGRVTTYSYDNYGNNASIQVGGQAATQLNYDPAGRWTSMTDAEGAAWSFEWNGRDLQTREVDPRGRSVIMAYDAAGRLVRRTERDGLSTDRAYSPAGELTSVSYANGTTRSFRYDLLGRLIEAVNPEGTVQYAYDKLDRIVRKIDVFGLVIEYDYDEADNVTRTVLPDGKAIDYQYNEFGDLARITSWLGSTYTLEYDAAGRLSRETRFNGSTVEYQRDAAGRLSVMRTTSPDGSVIDERVVDYNGRNDVIGDSAELPTFLLPASGVRNAQYSPDGARLEEADGRSVAHDENGQITTIGPNRLITYNPQYLAASIAADQLTQFSYDAQLRKTRQIVDGVTTRHLRDQEGRLVAELDEADQVSKYFIYAGNRLVAMVFADGRIFDYQHDSSGNIIGLLDSKNDLVNRYRYTPFGEAVLVVEGFLQPFRWSGSLGSRHLGSGLYEMGARIYDSTLARFTSEDPIRFAGGSYNLFQYALNNPLNYVDPTGLSPQFASQEFGRSLRLLDGGSSFEKLYRATKGHPDQKQILRRWYKFKSSLPPNGAAAEHSEWIRSLVPAKKSKLEVQTRSTPVTGVRG